jgi:DNA-binding CsgD family transcriptional regulator
MTGADVNGAIIGQIFKSATVEDVLKVMFESCGEIGATMFSYHPEVMFDGIASAQSDVFAVGYPDEWVELYLRQGARLIDPGPDIIMRRGIPMSWHDALSSRKLTKAESDYVISTRKYGITSGYGFPLWGPNGQNAFVAMGFPPNLALPDEATIKSQHMPLLAGHQRICELTKSSTENLSLSVRECEVLTWVGRGKSNTDIASILSISADTVATYMRRIYFKLSCHDRIGAVIKALRLGLIRI